MSRALERAIERIERRIGFQVAEGDPLEMVVVKRTKQSKVWLRELFDGCTWGAAAIASLDEPLLMPRILVEAASMSTERGRAWAARYRKSLHDLLATRTDNRRPVQIEPTSLPGPIEEGRHDGGGDLGSDQQLRRIHSAS